MVHLKRITHTSHPPLSVSRSHQTSNPENVPTGITWYTPDIVNPSSCTSLQSLGKHDAQSLPHPVKSRTYVHRSILSPRPVKSETDRLKKILDAEGWVKLLLCCCFTDLRHLSCQWGARWLSGRVSDSGARGQGFETYRLRVVSLSKTLYSPKVLVNYPGSDGSVPTWLKNCWLGR